MYLLVSPFFKTFDDQGLVYLVPDFLKGEIKKGIIVEIPFKDKIEEGVVLGEIKDIDLNFDESKIKSIISIKNDDIFLNGYRVELLKWIASHYITPIHNSCNLFFPSNLKNKIKKDKIILKETKEFIYTYKNTKKLNSKQKDILNKIIKSKNNKILLYGVTGSGKTEIYINLINEYINQGNQVLFLIPEIILTNQLSDRLKNVFGEDVLILNSSITEASKTKARVSINSGNAKIIIGTRSSLFYPYKNLGIIIIDEEHDNSYVSDTSPRYSSIEIAEKITELNGNKLLLASGTPSINSMYKAINKEYELLNLLKKY